jgi:MYXO-CTERM domain-containing protein
MKSSNRVKLAVRRVVARAFVLGPLTFLLVAGTGCPSLFESPTHRATRIKQAEPGRDGNKTITQVGQVVNAYGVLGTDASAGDTTITVAAIAALSTNFPNVLAKGDLLLIIQMQGATIDATDTTAYGTVGSLGNAGRYELVGVEGVSNNTITLACALQNDYAVAGKTQVIRVPQYGTLTINSGLSIAAPAWDGTTGGVVAVHALTTVQLDGSIDVSGRGFRGGAVDNDSDTQGTAVTSYRTTGTANNNEGAEKGEGIAGSQADYDANFNGRYGRGAPANAGGGGNSHNAGGGGGANAGNIANWGGGQGVMVSVTATPDPWRLDPGYTANSNARTNCEGGGRGGYSFSNADQDPLQVAPGTCSGATSWGGNCRREVGGLGGRPLASSPTTRLFMGGGGGAGDRNNGSQGSAGGRGGGLVFLIAGSIAGSGSILANGATAPNSPGVANAGDAPGGGGGGGTVVVNVGSLSAITISANGGGGGNQTGSGGQTEVEGPGGGGGGGYIAVSGTGSPSLSAAGGPNGTTNRTVMTDFPADGATAGHAGVTNGDASSFLYCGTAPKTTIATHPDDPTPKTVGSFTFTNTASPVTYACTLDGADVTCTASYTTPTLSNGSHTLTVQSTDSYGNLEATPVTFTWEVDDTLPLTTIATYPPNPSNNAQPTFTFTNTVSGVTYQCDIDGDGYAACSASYTVPDPLSDGPHTLSVKATTSGSVEEDPPVTYTWTVDTTQPTTTILTYPPNPSAVATGSFTFSSNEDPVTFRCKLDTADWVDDCGASYTTPDTLANGTHTLQVQAVDAAGNADDSPATYTWDVDTNLPLTTIATHPTDPTNNPVGTFSFTNTRSPVTYECKIDDDDFASCDADYTTASLPDGSHTLSVRATLSVVDAGALVEDPPVTFTWVIDTAPPDTTIASGPQSPSSSAAGSFTFTSSESPATYECSLDGGSWATCPASYTTPGLADGIHTLAVRATDAAGNTDGTPATYTWAIAAGGLDGGLVVLDAGESEAGAVSLDGAVAPGLDGGRNDVLPVDVGTVADAAAVADGPADTGPADVAADAPADTQTPGPDTAAPPAEPSPDTALPSQGDTALPNNQDAAPVLEIPRLRGGGCACAVGRSHSAAPSGLLLALAGLALLRHRRR